MEGFPLIAYRQSLVANSAIVFLTLSAVARWPEVNLWSHHKSILSTIAF